jgi:hypothetical protein
MRVPVTVPRILFTVEVNIEAVRVPFEARDGCGLDAEKHRQIALDDSGAWNDDVAHQKIKSVAPLQRDVFDNPPPISCSFGTAVRSRRPHVRGHLPICSLLRDQLLGNSPGQARRNLYGFLKYSARH